VLEKPTGDTYRPNCTIKRYDVAEITVFHIQCRNEKRRPKARQHGQDHECRQQHQTPARQEAYHIISAASITRLMPKSTSAVTADEAE